MLNVPGDGKNPAVLAKALKRKRALVDKIKTKRAFEKLIAREPDFYSRGGIAVEQTVAAQSVATGRDETSSVVQEEPRSTRIITKENRAGGKKNVDKAKAKRAAYKLKKKQGSDASKNGGTEHSGAIIAEQINARHDKPRFNPLAKAAAEAKRKREEAQRDRELAMQDKAAREQERKQYYQKRGADHKQLMQRTSKGQPVMAGQIAHLLAKLEKMRK